MAMWATTIPNQCNSVSAVDTAIAMRPLYVTPTQYAPAFRWQWTAAYRCGPTSWPTQRSWCLVCASNITTHRIPYRILAYSKIPVRLDYLTIVVADAVNRPPPTTLSNCSTPWSVPVHHSFPYQYGLLWHHRRISINKWCHSESSQPARTFVWLSMCKCSTAK